MGLLDRLVGAWQGRGRLARAPSGHTGGRLAPASVQRAHLGLRDVDLPAGVVRLRTGDERPRARRPPARSAQAAPAPRLPRPTLGPLRDARARVGAAWREALVRERDARTVLDAVAPEWAQHDPDAYTVGANGRAWHCRTLALAAWPAHVSPAWLAGVLFDPHGGDVQVAVHSSRLPQTQARRAAHRLRTAHVTDAHERAAGGFLADPDTQLTIASAEEVAANVAAGTEGIHRVGLAIALRAPTPAALGELEARVRDTLDALGCQVASCKWEQREGFLSAAVPYAADRLGRVARVDTTTLAMSFPFLSGTVGTRDGALLGVQAADGRPVFFDTWATDEGWPGPHLVIVAPNGAGKTVTIGHRAAEWLTRPDPPQVIFCDPAKLDCSGARGWPAPTTSGALATS